SASRQRSYASLRISHQSTATTAIGSPAPRRTNPWTNSGSTISLTGAIPPPMHGWPMGGVTSSVKVATESSGAEALAVYKDADAAAAARNSRRVTRDMLKAPGEREE